MKGLTTICMLMVVVSLSFAQTPITSFPYFYDWTNPAKFTLQVDGETYLGGGDGFWGSYRAVNHPQFAADAARNLVISNDKNYDDVLFLNVDARGRSFNGSEVFTFDAARSGGSTTGTLKVYANGQLLKSLIVETDLSTSMHTYTAPIPASLANSVFTLSVIVNTNNTISLDNTGITGGALPITLASLRASMEAAAVKLSWSTLSEIDNYGFYVQKSDDMKSWQDVASSFQPGYGTTTEAHTYTFSDCTLPIGKFYRLRQVDLNGDNHYSDPVSVTTGINAQNVAEGFRLQQNYPNPFNPTTTLRYSVGGVVAPSGASSSGAKGPATNHTKLVVYDVLGRQVATLVDAAQAPGTYEVRFDGGNLATGIYVYKLTSGGFSETHKMMLTK